MSTVKRCAECGDIITDDMDYVEGKDDPDLCDICNEDQRD